MSRFELIDWYDVPRYYDMVFAEGTREEASFLERLASAHGREGRRVLEPGCGSGRLMEAMARRGWSVSGFDRNPHMVDYAQTRMRRTKLGGTVYHSDMERFRTRGKFDVAHCLVSTFKYLLSETAAVSHLRCVARALRPGGIYVLGFHLTDYESTRCSRERWVATSSGVTVISNLQVWPADRRRRLEKVRARLRVEERGRVRQLEWKWAFRTYGIQQIRRMVRSVPVFTHVETYDFSYDQPRLFDGDRLDVVLVLRRR